MTAHPEWQNLVLDARRDGLPIALMFDYDGTLAPIESHPKKAILASSLREDIRALAAIPGVTVGVISGRSLDDLSAMIGLEGVYLAGSSGAELDLAGLRITSPDAENILAALTRVSLALGSRIPSFPGVWIESKPVGMTVHYRGAEHQTILGLREFFGALMGMHNTLHYLDICEALEVTSATGWDKGTAVMQILTRLPTDVFPVFVGDSANDEPAMRVVNDLGGVTVGVGSTAPIFAKYRIDLPSQLHLALSELRSKFTQLESLISEGYDQPRLVP